MVLLGRVEVKIHNCVCEAREKMNNKQRELFAAKVLDLGNYAVAGMVFTQFILGIHADPFTLELGIAIALICYFEAFLLSE